MKKKMKLKLSSLEVSSFVTRDDNPSMETIKGGAGIGGGTIFPSFPQTACGTLCPSAFFTDCCPITFRNEAYNG